MEKNALSIKISSYILFFFFINYSLSFDVRNGMSKQWKSWMRNQVNPLVEEKFDIKFAPVKTFLRTNKVILEKIKTVAESLNLKSEVKYREEFLDIKIDHYSSDIDKTFKLRALINDDNFDKNIPNSPILFYCGNEGNIEEFWNNSGFITENLATKFKALVIFGEHRFFGKSFPNGGPQDFDIRKNKFLTVEQAMADFVEILQIYRKKFKIENTHPIIAFGGSYGGMLAAWSRMKFPHIFTGAIASSAPILLFEDIDKISNNFFKIVTETYKRYDFNCPDDIRKGFKSLDYLSNTTSKIPNNSTFDELSSIFKTCSPIKSSNDIRYLEDTIEDAIISLAQYNYPYETSFLNPTPGYPVKVACENIAKYKNDTRFSSLIMDSGK